MKKIRMAINKEMTFKEGVESYIQDCISRNLRKGTIRHYTDSIKQIYKVIDENTPISDLSQTTINNLVSYFKQRGDVNDMTINLYSRDLKTLMNYFIRMEWLEYQRLRIPKADQEPIECYTDNELKALLKKPRISETSFTEYKAWVITNFLLSTGIRQNSLINIKIKDIDFDNAYVSIKVTKNRKALIIPLNKDIVLILKEYLKYRGGDPDDYLFCNVFGKQLTKSTLYHSHYEYNINRGVSTTGLHRFRHTFAKKFIMAGGNPVTLQKILGHSSLAITEHYLNILVSELKSEVEEYSIIAEFKNERIKM